MFNLIQLFLRYSSFLVFLVLEIICFSLIVKYNQKQNSIYVNSVNRFVGYLQSKSAAVRQYLYLQDENVRLAMENALLRERLLIDRDSLIKLDTIHLDSMTRFTFTEARVINNSINRNHNYFTLDKGARSGIRPHTAVVTNEGVAGIVRKVSADYSVAMSVLHRQMRISATVRRKNYFGTLVWKGGGRQLFNLEEIPKNAPVTKGDTIETSGYSGIFPRGIFLGTVETILMEPGSNYFTIEVRSKVNMSNIQHAYVIRDIFGVERRRLEQDVLSEDE